MTDLEMVISAARKTKRELEDFAANSKTLHPDHYVMVVHDMGAFSIFLRQLEAIQDAEMPR